MRTTSMKTFSGLIMLTGIVLAVLSTGHNLVSAQGVKAQEITVAYDELSLASFGNAVRLDWAPDGEKFAVSTGNDLRIYTYDLVEIAHWQGHTDLITSVDWKPDGTRIATASMDGTIRVWDAVDTSPTYGNTLYTLAHTDRVFTVRWSPVATDNRLASREFTGLERTSDGAWTLSVVNIWDVDTQAIILTVPTLPTQRDVANLIWSPDGQYLMYSALEFSTGQVISIWDTTSGKLLSDFTTSVIGVRINDIAWQPNGNVIAYVDELNRIATAEVQTDGSITYLNEFRATPDYDAFGVSWDKDGTKIAMGDTENRIYIWDPIANEAWVFSTPHADDVIQVEWSPDGERIASLSRDDVVRIWSLNNVEVRDNHDRSG